jgi:hypothetical protein
MNIHSSKATVALAMASLAMLPAFAAPPAAPQVTVGADTKLLQFDWEVVPQSNYYELWFKANDGAPYVKFSESEPWRPHASSSVSAHLLDWVQARYQVRACNPSGCGASAPIAVDDFMADTIGYFKARRLHNNGRFGIATAISEDGKTLAAFTAGETTPDFPKAAVYVFVKSGSHWVQQARLIPESGVDPFRNLGLHPGSEATLSLSGDGNVLVAGMAFKDPSRDLDSAGITVYRRSGGQWTQEYQNIRVQTLGGYVGSFFSEIDEAGQHILFRPGSYRDPTEMLTHTASGWTSQLVQQPPSDLANGYGCASPRLSGDGQSIAWACTQLLRLDNKTLFVSRPPGWQLTESVAIPFPSGHLNNRVAIDYSGKTIAVGSAAVTFPIADPQNQVRVFSVIPNTTNAWNISDPIRAGAWNTSTDATFGTDLDLSRDGALLAILDPRDTGQGTGVLSPPLQTGTTPTGATYVYELRAQGPRLRRLLKPNNPIPEGGLFDGQVRFGNNGKTLAVSEPDEPGNSSGIDGDRNAGGRIKTGAVWLY